MTPGVISRLSVRLCRRGSDDSGSGVSGAGHAAEEGRTDQDEGCAAPLPGLADHYARTGQDRLAISQYEEMLRIEPDNPELWEGLRKVDPVTADRLERLRNAPPDPFVAEGKGIDMSDLDDFGDEDEYEEPEQEEVAGAPFQAAPVSDDDLFLDDDDESDYEPLPWEHEQDAEFRLQVEQNPAFQDVMDGCALFWEDPQGWSHLLGEARAPEDLRWKMLDELAPAAAADLHAQIPTILVAPGHAKCPIPLPLKNPTLVLSESQQFALGNQEVLFVLGMGTHGLLNENAQLCWGCQVIAERELDCELRERVLHNASEFTVGWDERMPREEVARIRKLCHAYELRAVLSADRAGLLACESNSPRQITVAGFKKENSPVVLLWYSDAVPSDELKWDPVDLVIEKTAFQDPVYVEMITGRVYELDKAAWNNEGEDVKFTKLPVWDSPVMIAERALVPLREDKSTITQE